MAIKQDTADKTSETPAEDVPVTPQAAPALTVPSQEAEDSKIKSTKAVSKIRPAPKAAPKVAAKAVKSKMPPASIRTVAAKPVKRAASVSKGTMHMNDIISKLAADAKARTEAMTAELGERTKDALAKTSKLAQEAAEFNKSNVEAVVASTKIAAKNLETLRDESMGFARKSFEDSSAAMQSLTSIKSPTEFFKLYAENSKKAFDTMVSQTSKNSELLVKMTSESFAPISNRMSVITSTLKVA